MYDWPVFESRITPAQVEGIFMFLAEKKQQVSAVLAHGVNYDALILRLRLPTERNARRRILLSCFIGCA
jgi:hypothetical protein